MVTTNYNHNEREHVDMYGANGSESDDNRNHKDRIPVAPANPVTDPSSSLKLPVRPPSITLSITEYRVPTPINCTFCLP